MRIKSIMTKNPITISKSSSVLSAARKMKKNSIGTLLVVSRGKLEGIITERDILNKVVARNINPSSVKVSDVMTSKIITADDSIDDIIAAYTMRKFNIKKLPILDKNNNVVGIVTETDLLRVLGEKWILEDSSQ